MYVYKLNSYLTCKQLLSIDGSDITQDDNDRLEGIYGDFFRAFDGIFKKLRKELNLMKSTSHTLPIQNIIFEPYRDDTYEDYYEEGLSVTIFRKDYYTKKIIWENWIFTIEEVEVL